MRYHTLADVESVLEMRVLQHRPAPSAISNRQHKGQGCIVECDRRCPYDCSGHVGDAVMNDALLDKSRRRMSCRPARLEAASLIYRNVDNDRTRSHRSNELAAHELGSRGARDQDGADYQIGRDDFALDIL